MLKIIITLALVGIGVVFGLQNSDHVEVSFVIGSPAKVRLVFLLVIFLAIGYCASYIQGLRREIHMRRRFREQLARFAPPQAPEVEDRQR